MSDENRTIDRRSLLEADWRNGRDRRRRVGLWLAVRRPGERGRAHGRQVREDGQPGHGRPRRQQELEGGRRRQVPAAAGHSHARRGLRRAGRAAQGEAAPLYGLMSASRKWETTMKDLFVSGKDGLYGAFHTYVGEEAVAVGVMSELNDDDYIASTHRGHGHLIAKGGDLNKMSAEIFFKKTGYNQGYGGSMHITDMSKGIMGMNGIVGASFYMAAGAAMRAHGPRHEAGERGVLRRWRGGVALLLQRHPQLRQHQARRSSSSTRTTCSTWACRWPSRCRPSTSRSTPRGSTFRISWSTATTSRPCTRRPRRRWPGRAPARARA